MKKYILMLALNSITFCGFAAPPVVDNSDNFKKMNLAQSSHQAYPFDLDEGESGVQQSKETPEVAPQSENGKMQLLLSKMDAMQQEILELRGQIEVQAHKLGKIKGERAEAKPVQVPAPKQVQSVPVEKEDIADTTVVPKLQSRKDPVDEQLSYVGAFELVKNREYEKAIPAMAEFLKLYPNGPYAANAHYWLGELLLLKHDLQGAATEFNTVVTDFSDSNKLAASKLKLGVTYLRLGSTDKAKLQFQQVTEQFPNTSAARLAKAKLDDI
jgi:tol-pal system protein YbgF